MGPSAEGFPDALLLVPAKGTIRGTGRLEMVHVHRHRFRCGAAVVGHTRGRRCVHALLLGVSMIVCCFGVCLHGGLVVASSPRDEV
jgi:hypothetical protein